MPCHFTFALALARPILATPFSVSSFQMSDVPSRPAASCVYVLRRLAPPGLEGLLEFITFSTARLLFLFSPADSFDPLPVSPEPPLSARSLSFSRPLPDLSNIFTEELLPDERKREGGNGGKKCGIWEHKEQTILKPL